jgi:putative ABC transport system substrate-binding protein
MRESRTYGSGGGREVTRVPTAKHCNWVRRSQCITRPFTAVQHSVRSQGIERTCRGHPGIDANDPSATSAVHRGNGFDARFEPYQSSCLSLYNAPLSLGADMRRREFITLLGGAPVSWPRRARAQQSERVRRIGVLVPLPATDPVFKRNMVAFIAAMKSAGWTEGRNLDIPIVSILGSGKSPTEAAADVLSLLPDAVVAVTPVSAEALRRQTSAVPVVFVVGWFDPVEKGFVTAINQPGGNMTGITDLEPSLGGKWLQLLKKIAPDTARAGVVYNPDEGTISAPLLQAIEEAARHIGIELVHMRIRDEAEIDLVIASFAGYPNGGLIFPSDIFTAAHRARIIAAANGHRIPTVFPYRYFAADGGLASYSPSQTDEFGQAAYFVDRILRGEKPAVLPVQTPNKYELVINLETAKALGLEVPPMLLATADEVIE